MHNNEFKWFLNKFLIFSGDFLPILFWLTLIFSFDSPKIGVLTVIAIVIHELGHIIAFLLTSNDLPRLRGVVSGLRISASTTSYTADFFVYLGGPLANLLAACAAIPWLGNEYASAFFAVNAATCVSNLPVAEGYDGYGMLRCLVMRVCPSRTAYNAMEGISLFTTVILLMFSLYLIDRLGEGYWIFLVFFFSMIKKLAMLLKKEKFEI